MEWISVKNEVPEMGVDVLAVWPGGSRKIVHINTRNLWVFGGTPVDPPTHWQLLPEPPPKPDAFEEWCSGRTWEPCGAFIYVEIKGDPEPVDTVLKRAARIIWDAAVESMKGDAAS